MDSGLSRRQLLAVMPLSTTPGCFDPPTPQPPPEFLTRFERDDGVATVSIRRTQEEPLQADRVRVTVGDTVVYSDGRIRGGYADGPATQNGWGAGIDEGAELVLSTEGYFPFRHRLRVQTRDSGGWESLHEELTPPPPVTISAALVEFDGEDYITVTHEAGVALEAEHVDVTLPGDAGFLGGEVTGGLDAPAAVDEWSDGLEPGDRLRLLPGARNFAGQDVSLQWNGSPTGKPETIARTTVEVGAKRTATPAETESGRSESS